MRFTSKNRVMVKILSKLFKIPAMVIKFDFYREMHDEELTELAFINQSMVTFDETVAEFREKVEQRKSELS